MLSPCELVWTIRTWADAVAASRLATARTTAARMSATFLAHHGVEAPDARPARRDVEKRETEQRSVNSLVHLRREQTHGATRPHRRLTELHHVHIEVGNGHFAARDKRRDAGKEAEQDHQ